MPAKQQLEKMIHKYGDSIFRMCYLYLKDYHYAATFAIVLLLGGTTATAVKYFNDMHVNQELLPELDEMYLVEINEIKGATDGYDGVTMEFQGYEELEKNCCFYGGGNSI